MSAEDNVASAQRIIEEAWNQGNLEAIDELCSPDFVDHDLALHEDSAGLEANKERIRGFRSGMSNLNIAVDDCFGGGDEVVTRWRARGTNDGELLGNPPTNRDVEVTGISIDRFDADGKLVETWDQWDAAGFMQQLGIGAPTEAARAG